MTSHGANGTNDASHEPAAIEWRAALTRLAKALATSLVAALARGIATIAFFALLNVALAVAFFFLVPLTGRGHGSLVAVLLALVPFAPFAGFAIVLAQKQGVQRLIAGAVESQGPTVAQVGAHLLARFFTERASDLEGLRASRTFDSAWQRYLQTRAGASWPVRLVLSQVSKRIPVGNFIDELAANGTPPAQIPQRAMERAVLVASDRTLRPSWTPTLLLFGFNCVWFPVALVLARAHFT
jgi:hypothetical protein